MNRRSLLYLAGLTAAAKLTAASRPADAPTWAELLPDPRLLAKLAHHLQPGLPSDRATLESLAGLAGQPDPHRAMRAFAARRRADFRAGRIVIADGWVMAVAEAALCCLAART